MGILYQLVKGGVPATRAIKSHIDSGSYHAGYRLGSCK